MATSKKALILDAALTLFTETGFHGTSTAAIAKAAGVATGTLFHHFPTKEALIIALYRDIKQELAGVLAEGMTANEGKPSFPIIWTNGVAWLVEQPQKLAFILLCSHSLYFSPDKQMAIWQDILGFVSALLERGITLGVVKQLPINYLFNVCESLLLSTASYVASLPLQEQELAIELSINVIVDAISQPGADLTLISR